VAKSIVDKGEGGIKAIAANEFALGINHPPIPLFALAQRLFHLFAGGHIQNDGVEVWLPLNGDGAREDFDIPYGSVGQPMLKMEDGAVFGAGLFHLGRYLIGAEDVDVVNVHSQ
jgi:hypothetical protein